MSLVRLDFFLYVPGISSQLVDNILVNESVVDRLFAIVLQTKCHLSIHLHRRSFSGEGVLTRRGIVSSVTFDCFW